MATIIILKILGVLWITLMSAIGIWAPFLCVGSTGKGLVPIVPSGPGSRHVNPRPSHVSSGRMFLSLANCFSAGMLLTMALAHFFPSALAASSVDAPLSSLSAWMLAGVLIPALLEHGAGGGGHSHSHGMSADHGAGHDRPERKFLSTSTLLILLMCFHGVMEGVLLGLEDHASSLVSAAMPLSIHRFFDGLVIGVSMAKEVLRTMRSELSDSESQPLVEECSSGCGQRGPVRADVGTAGGLPRGGAVPAAVVEKVPFAICGRRVWRPAVLVWLAITPATTVLVLLWASLGSVFASADAAADRQALASTLRPGAHSKAKSGAAIAQAVGSGSFVYVGLSIFLHEELKGLKASLAMLFGVGFTFLLFTLSGDKH